MFEKYFLGFFRLKSYIKQLIIGLHGKKALFLPKKKIKKRNKLPDLYTYVYLKKNELQGKLEKQQLRTALFQFGFLLKS